MAVEKAIGSSSLVEVVDRILDKGIVIDAWVRVSLVGIELLAIEGPGCRGVGGDVPEVRRGSRPDRDRRGRGVGAGTSSAQGPAGREPSCRWTRCARHRSSWPPRVEVVVRPGRAPIPAPWQSGTRGGARPRVHSRTMTARADHLGCPHRLGASSRQELVQVSRVWGCTPDPLQKAQPTRGSGTSTNASSQADRAGRGRGEQAELIVPRPVAEGTAHLCVYPCLSHGGGPLRFGGARPEFRRCACSVASAAAMFCLRATARPRPAAALRFMLGTDITPRM